MLEALLEAGADVNALGENDVTPLLLAAGFNENPAVLEALLEAGADVNAAELYRRSSRPLHAAASRNKNPAVVKALLEAGANRGGAG